VTSHQAERSPSLPATCVLAAIERWEHRRYPLLTVFKSGRFAQSQCFMTLVVRPQAADMSGDSSNQEGNRSPMTGGSAEGPTLNPELVRRFHALVDEVTVQLMQGRGIDRQTCRADAISLLIATNEHLDDSPEGGESPLRYLLLEEQRKAATVQGNAEPLHGAATTLLRV